MVELTPQLVSRSLQFYKRRDVQEAILRHAQNREISPRYGEGFGKRPDALFNEQDILEFAKRRSTSFHCSEERWDNPLMIQTGASRKEMDSLRIGWDLVLDIDAPNWELSRLTAWLFIQSLKAHDIKSISVKFSGNKGWHIGVPWESFPEHMLAHDGERDIPTKNLFPELPRAIASYLLEFMSDVRNGIVSIKDDSVLFGGSSAPLSSSVRTVYTIDELSSVTGKPREKLIEDYCPSCRKTVTRSIETYALDCYSCQYRHSARFTREQKESFEDKQRMCPRCAERSKKSVMEFTLMKSSGCAHNPSQYERRIKLSEIIEVDTILIAGRHLYRMPYSLHEKSGLVSVVIPEGDVLDFDKSRANPSSVDLSMTFLDSARTIEGDASRLAKAAWQFQGRKEESSVKRNAANQAYAQELDVVVDAIPKEHFPPCMLKILDGGMLDGKKRSMFALTNFLVVCGWSPDMIEAELHSWNSKNPEPLREVVIKGHMRQVRMKPERIMPPSCKEYYQSMNLCHPNEFCSRIRNPAQYALKHSKLGEKPKRRRKSDDDFDDITPGSNDVDQNGVRKVGQADGQAIVKIRKAKKEPKQSMTDGGHEKDGESEE